MSTIFQCIAVHNELMHACSLSKLLYSWYICTGDNPLAKARGLSSHTDAQPYNNLRPFYYITDHSKRPLKKKTKISFHGRLSLNAGQKYYRMLRESILHYFRPSLSYHLSLRPLNYFCICLFLSGCLRQVLMYKLKYGLCLCTGDNPLANVRRVSSPTDAQTIQ